jgi:hypothetical protein
MEDATSETKCTWENIYILLLEDYGLIVKLCWKEHKLLAGPPMPDR